MRFDGYYILSDLLEIPNMMQRSFKMLQFQMQRAVYRLDKTEAPTTDAGEGAILTVYGVAAIIYRIFLFITITLFVMGKMFAIGLILAVWTAAVWFIMPVGKFINWLSTGPKLAEHRGRTIAITLGLFAAGCVLIGLIPAPDVRRGVGVVEAERRSGVFAGAEGFLERVLVEPGDRVEAGQIIAVIENSELLQRLRLGVATLDEYESLERQTTAEEPSAVDIARDRVAAQRQAVAFVRSRVDRLTVRAPHAGVFVGDLSSLLGSAVMEGDPLGEVIDLDDIRVAAALDQLDSAWLFDSSEPFGVRLKPVSHPSLEVRGGETSAIDAGQQVLPHAGLGFAGGGTIATDPQRGQGRLAETPQFIVYIEPEPASVWTPTPGERVHLRFDLTPKPLLVQWVDRLHKMAQGRVRL